MMFPCQYHHYHYINLLGISLQFPKSPERVASVVESLLVGPLKVASVPDQRQRGVHGAAAVGGGGRERVEPRSRLTGRLEATHVNTHARTDVHTGPQP